MFFEDEKEIIREGADIHIDEDGTVTWEDVLNTDDDISVLDNNKPKTDDMIDLGDELELVPSDDEIDDAELSQILSQEQTQTTQNVSSIQPKQQENNTQAQTEEDFDIDSQLANVVLEQNKTENESYTPRKSEKQTSSSSVSPLLIVLLLILIIGGGGYYGWQFLDENDMLGSLKQQELTPKPSPQETMNNITPEQLEQRQMEQEEIPVVSEQEAQEIKPEEEKTEEKVEEKKQVINVIPTGRSNPFMPIPKYATTEAPNVEILYDKSGIPKPPEVYGIKEEETTQLMSIAVSGIMYDDTKPSAIITLDNNDYFVQKGDKLENYRIVEIARNYVLIALGKNVYRANIGEEFKVSQDFYGKAQFMPQAQGGGKQYHIVSTEAGQNNSSQKTQQNNGLRYVSEEDITIKAR